MEDIKHKLHKFWKWGAMVALVLLVLLGLYIIHWEFRAQVFEIYFFNLNKGRSIFIRTPHNKTVLVDGGQNSEIIRELTKVFPFYRRRIDLVILTASLPKNAGGLSEVLKRFSIGKVIEPTLMGTSTALSLFEKTVASKKLTEEKVEKGNSFEIDGVRFGVLFPDPLFTFNKTNTPELVLKISYASTTLILLGDVSKTIQKSFIGKMGKVDLVEYAHGASDSRTSGDLFNEMNPRYVLIKKQIRAPSTKALKNPPKKPSFDIEKQQRVDVINLEKEETIHFISDGEELNKK